MSVHPILATGVDRTVELEVESVSDRSVTDTKAGSPLVRPAPGPHKFDPQVWVLAGMHKGDNGQLLNLAEALAFSYRIDWDDQGSASIMADRIAGGRLTIRRRGAGALEGPPWPDLILLAGGRRVGDALRIKRASGGRSRIVCLGRPWANLAAFDIVVTTAQYCLPRRTNILHNTFTLNQVDGGELAAAAARWEGDFAHLKRPWTAVLAGGKSGSYSFGPEIAERLAKEANGYARDNGGSLLVTTSPRTPVDATQVLRRSLDCPHIFHAWTPDADANPYLGYLALADRFIVTCDSASVLSQACATGKPVKLFDYQPRLKSRIATALQRPLLPYLERLTTAGIWVPARDMTRFHDALARQGLLEPQPGEAEDVQAEIPDDLGRVVRSIRALVMKGLAQDVPEPKTGEAHGSPIPPMAESGYGRV